MFICPESTGMALVSCKRNKGRFNTSRFYLFNKKEVSFQYPRSSHFEMGRKRRDRQKKIHNAHAP